MTDTTRTSGHVLDEMKTLLREYETLVQEEMADLDTSELLRLAATKRSQWSGGHGLENMSEQVINETALLILQKLD